MNRWGPGQKRLVDGNEMLIRKGFRWLTGDTMHRAECTDGWESKNFTDYNDAEKDFSEHHKLQHGGK